MQEGIVKHPDNDEEIHFVDYFEVVLRRRKMILLATLAALVVSVVVALLLPKTYESTAKIIPPMQGQGLMGLMGQAGDMSGMASIASGLMGTGTEADQYASILQSEQIKDAIIDQFNLMKVYHQKYRFDMYQKMDKFVQITAGRKDGIIAITVEDNDPRRAADIANAYVSELEKLRASLNMYSGARNRVFIEGRLAKAKADLLMAEDALKAFQARKKAFQVPSQTEATIAGIAQLKALLASQEVQASMLRRMYTDSSQEVKNSTTSIANLRSQIASLENGNAQGAIPSLGSVPGLGRDYVRLMREFKGQEALVELLTKQHELASLIESDDVTSLQVVQKARMPDKKVKPKRRVIVLGMTFMGFVLSVAFTIVQYYLMNMPDNERQTWQRLKRAWKV
jgi:tyrosine-protein kinase Etk/Wzc